MATIDVNIKIETWKNKLLDLGKRNRLLNYRETKRSSLKILSPGCFDLFRSIVQDEQPIVFPYVTAASGSAWADSSTGADVSLTGEDNGDDENANGTDDDSGVADMAYPIKTNQSVKDTLRTLKSLRDKAKTAIEEQGVNILYLSFGFLQWRESETSDDGFNSPILIVPVSLTIESITSPYILNLHEDEIVINPTLAYKLENDFGLVLPKYNDGDELRTILNEVARLTRAKVHISVL